MHFEQSNVWMRFQEETGRKVHELAFPRSSRHETGGAAAAGFAVEKKIFGPFRYLEVSGWEPFSGMTLEQASRLLRHAGMKSHAVFVRWTPPREIPNPKSQIPNLKDIDIVEPRVLVHQVPPKATLVIDLAKNEDTLLQEMHEKTRYNIRLAERKGVEVSHASLDEGFENFWSLMQETAKRDRIGLHAKAYYRKMLEIVHGNEATAHLFFARLKDVPLATAILITCGDTATYLHGGSSSEQRNAMAPHLLQWRMMQFARAQGMRWYDMWGISPQVQSPKHTPYRSEASGTGFKVQSLGGDPWAGITRFKMGFGGEVREGAGTFDIMCKPLVYNLLLVLKRLKP